MMRMDMENFIQKGLTALMAGKKQEAEQIFIHVLGLDPGLEDAWLWLAGAVESEEEKRYCFLQVLSKNPQNTIASEGLRKLGNGRSKSPLHRTPSKEDSSLQDTKPLKSVLCPRCQAANPASYKNCDQCGASLQQKAPSQNNQPMMTFSTEVHLSQTICPRCRANIPQGGNYCPSCGYSFFSLEQTRDQSLSSSDSQVQKSVSVLPKTPSSPASNSSVPIVKQEKSQKAGTGKWFSMSGALSVIACFFLPWITVSCGSYGLLGSDMVETRTGFQLASAGSQFAQGLEPQGLYLVPVVASIAFVLLLFAGNKRISGGLATFITLLSLTGVVPLAMGFLALQEKLDEFLQPIQSMGLPAGYKIEIGFIGTIAGLIIMALGAIADAVTGD